MRSNRLLGAAFAAIHLGVAAALVSPGALAQASRPAVSAEDRAAAREAFAEGQQAFKDRDFRHAAQSFEAAYERAPHPDALWNAASSWALAGEKTRAANFYARYLEAAPPNARHRNSANDALQKLSTELGRLEIHAVDVEDLRLDGEPLTRNIVYVTPGTHLVQGRHGDQQLEKSPEVRAGTSMSIALIKPRSSEPQEAPTATAPAPAATAALPAAPPPDAPTPAAPPPDARPPSGLSPWFVLVGGGLTLGAAGAAVWSGLDTLDQKQVFDASRTRENFDTGRSKQMRTNLLIGVTSGLATITAATGLFFVDWHGQGKESGKESKSTRAELGVGPGSLTVRGVF